MTATILVTGATGTVGGELVKQLLLRGERVRAGSRRPPPAAGGVETVALDYERPETFAPALAGVDRLFLIARPGDEAPQLVAVPLLDEARRAGVRRVVNLTAIGVESRNPLGLRKVELHLESTGMAYTHLRPGFFMQQFSTGPFLAALRATSTLRLPAALERISYIDARDIAAVAAVALTEPGHEGQAYPLTGEHALDHHEIARTLSEVSGRAIRYEPISEEEARAAILAAGLSPERVERLLGFYRVVRTGAAAEVTPEVRRLLGRPALTFAEFARDHAGVWA